MMRLIMIVVGLCALALVFPQELQSLIGSAARMAQNAAATQSPSPDTRSGISQAVNTPKPIGGTVVLKAASNGHYYTRAMINGRPIKVVVDTGASVVALPYEDARALNVLPPPSAFTLPMQTANGVAKGARVTLLDVRLGSIRLSHVEAVVMPKGQLSVTLLGMSFLGRLSQASIRSGEMVLRP